MIGKKLINADPKHHSKDSQKWAEKYVLTDQVITASY